MGDKPLLIIGAGPAGLALACHHQGPTQIIEAGREVGGLCRSIEFGGALCDTGGHSFHTPFPEVAVWVAELMAGNWEEQRRDARVWFNGAMIPYPFQQHLDHIGDARIADECRSAMPVSASTAAGSVHFEEWIERRFGAGIAHHFMLPYNRKLWARDLSTMDTDWVAERVAGGEGETGAAPKRDSRISGKWWLCRNLPDDSAALRADCIRSEGDGN
jgi:protoporphyrinogen oxidase